RKLTTRCWLPIVPRYGTDALGPRSHRKGISRDRLVELGGVDRVRATLERPGQTSVRSPPVPPELVAADLLAGMVAVGCQLEKDLGCPGPGCMDPPRAAHDHSRAGLVADCAR